MNLKDYSLLELYHLRKYIEGDIIWGKLGERILQGPISDRNKPLFDFVDKINDQIKQLTSSATSELSVKGEELLKLKQYLECERAKLSSMSAQYKDFVKTKNAKLLNAYKSEIELGFKNKALDLFRAIESAPLHEIYEIVLKFYNNYSLQDDPFPYLGDLMEKYAESYYQERIKDKGEAYK